jgi:hypothetical protein
MGGAIGGDKEYDSKGISVSLSNDGSVVATGASMHYAAGSSSAADGGKATLTGGASSFTTGDGGATEVFAGDSTSQDDTVVAIGSPFHAIRIRHVRVFNNNGQISDWRNLYAILIAQLSSLQ